MDRWTLPGPAEFLSSMIEALRDGSSVVVFVPRPLASDVFEVVAVKIAEVWRTEGPVVPTGAQPVVDVHACLGLDDDSGSRRSVATILTGLESKSIVLVNAVESPHWPAWKQFIEEYANASRAIPAIDRTQFVVLVAGVPRNLLPGKAPVLRSMVWDGYVGEADVSTYIVHSWRAVGKQIDAQAKLIARIIVRLALWDFDLIDRMLGLDHRELFDPRAAIRSAIADNPAFAKIGATWEEGGLALFDGEELQHSVAILQAGDANGELTMRLWAAQAAELLPALEVNRRNLARRFKAARMPVPVVVDGEQIYDLNDVEIGPLLRHARRCRMPPDTIRLAEKFWQMRNKLAHLRPLGSDEALDEEVLCGRRR